MRVIVVRDALVFTDEQWIDERHLRQRSVRRVGEEVGDHVTDAQVLAAPQRGDREVGVVVAVTHLRVGEPVPDRGQLRDGQVVLEAVGLRGVHVEAVRERRRHDRGEVVVAHGPVGRGLAIERQVVARVVADRVFVVRAHEPAVAGAVVVLGTTARVGVVGVGVPAALELGEVGRRVGDPAGVEVGEPGLLAFGSREPPEEVVERPVLHHQDHDVLDSRLAGRRQHRWREHARGPRDGRGSEYADRSRSAGEAGPTDQQLAPGEICGFLIGGRHAPRVARRSAGVNVDGPIAWRPPARREGP